MSTFLCSPSVYAQEQGEDIVDLENEGQDIEADSPIAAALAPRVEEGRVIYDPAFFDRFAPQTAIDMVNEIPGFVISETSEDRGLGDASQNVLINGTRSAGKSNDARTVLGRLAASQIIRLEIVDGSSLSIPGLNGQVLNVVTAIKGLTGNFRYRTQFRRRVPNNLLDAELNITAPIGKGELTFGINNNGAFRRGNAGPEVVADGDGIC